MENNDIFIHIREEDRQITQFDKLCWSIDFHKLRHYFFDYKNLTKKILIYFFIFLPNILSNYFNYHNNIINIISYIDIIIIIIKLYYNFITSFCKNFIIYDDNFFRKHNNPYHRRTSLPRKKIQYNLISYILILVSGYYAYTGSLITWVFIIYKNYMTYNKSFNIHYAFHSFCCIIYISIGIAEILLNYKINISEDIDMNNQPISLFHNTYHRIRILYKTYQKQLENLNSSGLLP